MTKKLLLFISFGSLLLAACTQEQTQQAEAPVEAKKTTLEIVKERGKLICGVNAGLPGFSEPNSEGNWQGFDVDFCRAVSAAIFGDDTKVEYVGLNAQQRFTALQSGEVDILSRNTTWTLQRDTALGLNFGGVMYYDGQGFMVRKDSNIKSAKDLSGAAICVQSGTTTELNLADYFRKNDITFEQVVSENNDELTNSYFSGRCDAFTTDASGLASTRIKAENPDDHMILPEIISKEPLGPAVRQADDQWFDIVKWTVFALINAEELGVSSTNVDSANMENPDIKRLLDSELGASMGLDAKWAYNIVKLVGNYGEIFDSNLGVNTPLKLERGLNGLWNSGQGGILYAPPIR